MPQLHVPFRSCPGLLSPVGYFSVPAAAVTGQRPQRPEAWGHLQAASGLRHCPSEKHNHHPPSSFFIIFSFPCQLEALTPAFLGSCQSPPSAWRPAGGGRARCSALSLRRRGRSTRAPAGKGQGGHSQRSFFPRSPAFRGCPRPPPHELTEKPAGFGTFERQLFFLYFIKLKICCI